MAKSRPSGGARATTRPAPAPRAPEEARNAVAESHARMQVPAWLPLTSTILAVAGLLVSAYLTYEHFNASTTLACPDSGVINCLKVTTSAQSKVFGIPVALLGLLFFVAMVPACLPAAWRSANPWMRRARLAAATVGILFVFYLIYAELFIINNICLWCTAVHVITVALFAVIAFGTAALDPIESRK
jgi:uncharacterized membrane protein